jgi:photosystem II stability/assembly factor-like uncharacterized protein
MMPGCCLLLLLAASGLPAHHVYHGVAVAPDGHNAWVVCSDTVAVYHTRDLGTTWEAESANSVRSFYDVCFLDSLNGWACGSAGAVYHTTDGGRTWQRQNLGGPKVAARIRFRDLQRGLVCGDGGTGLRTTDSGSTWDWISLYGHVSGSPDLSGVWFTPGDTTWLACGMLWDTLARHGCALRRLDAYGDSFEIAYESLVYDLTDVCFSDPSHASVVGGGDADSSGIVLHSEDGGLTWGIAYAGSPAPGFLFTEAFASESLGCACGVRGTIIRTSDGGLSWQRVSVPTTATLYDIEFADRWRGMAAGDGVVLRTTDGGTTWTPVTPVAITEPAAPSAQTALSLSVIQNPARGRAEFTVTGVTGSVELAILDALGRQVAITHGRSWDGRGESGRLLPSGIYFARLTSRGTTLATPFTYLSR